MNVNEAIYNDTASLPSNIEPEKTEELTIKTRDNFITRFFAKFKKEDDSPTNFDEADAKTESAIERIATDFEDEDSKPHRDKIMNAVFNRSNIYELRDTLLINEYIMLMFNNRITEHNSSAFYDQCEVEYIIYGNKSQEVNATFAFAEISGHRLVTNVLSLYSCAPKSMAVVRQLASAIAAWQGGLTYFAWELVVAGVYSGIEASIDTYELINGQKVPMIKQDNDFLLGGPSRLRELALKATDTINNQVEKNNKKNTVDESKIKVKGLIDKDSGSGPELAKKVSSNGPELETKGTTKKYLTFMSITKIYAFLHNGARNSWSKR